MSIICLQIITIQACQESSHADVFSYTQDARKTVPDRQRFVMLDRPHTLLLMSTVAGGYAIRGAFTGAMARQFAKADGKITINDMVTNAIVDMKKNEKEDYNQTPEARNTLQKSLIPPPVDFNPTLNKAVAINPRENFWKGLEYHSYICHQISL